MVHQYEIDNETKNQVECNQLNDTSRKIIRTNNKYRMKKYLLFVVGIILASCSDQFNVENVVDAVIEPSVSS